MSAASRIAASDAPKGKGGTAEAARPIQEKAMLNVVERPSEGKSKQEVLDFLYEGFVKVSALEMNRVLQVCQYDHQRVVNDRHVAVLSDLMTRGQWQPKSQLDFAVLNGKFILVNGYHRAYAQVRSGKPIEWSVVFHSVKSEAELRSLYFAFDTNIRIRGTHDILRANEFADTHGLGRVMSEALYRAVPYIASSFETNPKRKNYLVEKQVDRRLQLASEYAKAAARFEACLEGLGGSRRKKLLSGAVVAVAVITLRFQSARAWEFWAGVANNDGLKRGDPRQALINDMMTRTGAANKLMAFAPSIIAWNAFYDERELRLIKVLDSFAPIIDGTPFDGKRKA